MDNTRKDDMMDRNSIKDTGILEQYLLGELSDKQMTEVENILKQDQELREYFLAMEDDFEKLAIENAIPPPIHIKKSLLTAVASTKTLDDSDKVISIKTKDRRSIYMTIAASFALLFALSSGWLYNQWQTARNTIKTVQNQTVDFQNRINTLENQLNETNKWYTAINTPNTIQLILKGNKISPNSTAITYVNHTEKTVILNAKGLVKLDQNKTYQMWADVDGEMIDMGIVASNQDMIAMKYIDNAASINITIEPAGGNDHPTVERLISNVFL
ncbi:hypothetical protein AWE51_14475 [Aquimarina aggregata]|uniref:Anti-sigma K factor RskA C-terminal domain-containing protein n=1 Tax=Aquimarina aggregata TaxID=1642818 RepID=A0A162XV50_9FLAO|nr:anti-sigma factor [Aquimarina aggregata]KZS38788.1 hypothetical protein AWE51_14475 [Aquimarina aggregata]